MDKSRSRTTFVCQQCGKESIKWLGHCPECQGWNTFTEVRATPQIASKASATKTLPAQELAQLTAEASNRLTSSFREFNRVLGGGIVPGSLVLIGGDPGVGKSTLLLSVSDMIARDGGRVVYISGEESLSQIKLRADRLKITGKGLYLLCETSIELAIQRIQELSPTLVVIDSIQAVKSEELAATAGSIAQVRYCTSQLMEWGKSNSVPVIIAGHVTKDGTIAGPKVLEHIVDVVLYLESEPSGAYRLLRSIKNRFGSTNEVGIFEMREQGLVEIDNPSQVFLTQRSGGAVGSTVVSIIEGTRALLVEIQALTNPTSFGLPRRTANGIDFNRLLLVTAVLSKRAGLPLSNQDVLVNVTGGLRIEEPAADLGVALSIASSLRDIELEPDLVAVGEIGLSGELRAVPQLERRIAEAQRLGFKRCLTPRSTIKIHDIPSGIELIQISTIREALRAALSQGADKHQ